MMPSLPFYDSFDGFPSHSEKVGDLEYSCSSVKKSPYLNHLIFRETRCPMPGTLWSPSFFNCILHVLFMGSKKHVVWSDAWWVVALVANFKSVWYRTVLKLPSVNMCGYAFSIYPKCTVSVGKRGGSPNPTSVSLLDLFPKSCFSRLSTCLGTEVTFPRVNVAGWAIEFFSACVTFDNHLKTFLSGVRGLMGCSIGSQILPQPTVNSIGGS